MSETLKRRPWWAAALVGGGAAGAAIVAALGGGARGESPRTTMSTIGPAVQEAVTAEQVRSLGLKIDSLQFQLAENIRQVGELNGRLSKLEGRLEKR